MKSRYERYCRRRKIDLWKDYMHTYNNMREVRNVKDPDILKEMLPSYSTKKLEYDISLVSSMDLQKKKGKLIGNSVRKEINKKYLDIDDIWHWHSVRKDDPAIEHALSVDRSIHQVRYRYNGNTIRFMENHRARTCDRLYSIKLKDIDMRHGLHPMNAYQKIMVKRYYRKKLEESAGMKYEDIIEKYNLPDFLSDGYGYLVTENVKSIYPLGLIVENGSYSTLIRYKPFKVIKLNYLRKNIPEELLDPAVTSYIRSNYTGSNGYALGKKISFMHSVG